MKSSVFSPRRSVRLLGYVLAVALLVAPTAMAQEQSGNVFGTVRDGSGIPLPGVTVTLSGIGAPRVFVTNQQGDFRYLSLSPGTYQITADLAGFGTVSRSNIGVNVGRNTTVDLTLQPAVAQTITVTAETPLLDVRKTGTGAVATEIDLQEIPTARDPWVIMQQVPGVLMDRINVGGNESGQQSNAIGKGANRTENTWSIDGVNHTDMAATGASAMYYDFDSFQEIQSTTSSSDPRVQTPGIQMNLVTKRGTNDFRGSGRYFLTDRDFQADAKIPDEAVSYLRSINEITEINDYGVEVGGPIWRDRMWFWGAYSMNEIDLNLASGTTHARDYTELKNWSGKLNAQIMSNNSATGLYTHADKIKLGRNVSTARPPDSAWNQDGPSPVWKIEDTHIFSPNFYLTGLYSYVGGGFNLVSATLGPNDAYWEDGVWHRGYISYYIERPQDPQYRLDGSAFFDTGSLNHELKFGFGYREAPANTKSIWPGNGNYANFYTGQCDDLSDQYGVTLPSNCGTVYLTRDGDARWGSDYTDLYVGDTILMGNLTLQAGLRYDLQTAINFPGVAEANSLIPDILPGGVFPGDTESLEWTSITPRIGATYMLGSTRRTILRAAYNQYVDQLASGLVVAGNPIGVSAMAFVFEDRNGNKQADAGELRTDLDIYDFYGLDPDNPGVFGTSNVAIDYDMDPPKTDEFLIGVEQELMPEFTIGLNYSHRMFDDFVWTAPVKADGSFYSVNDYELAGNVTGTIPGGAAYSEPFYRLKPGIARATNFLITNRPGYQRTYDGLELTATKRLSNRWMMRGNFSWNDWQQQVDPEGFVGGDPTKFLSPTVGHGGCSSCDNETVVSQSAGSGAKGNIFISSHWSYNVSGLYQFPWDISLGASLYGWEGFPIPYVHNVTTPHAGAASKAVLVDGIEPVRNEDIMNLDLRLAKEFRLAGVGLTISADLFNATDERPIMQRNRILFNSLTAANVGANRITEIQSPRVYRLGARLSF